MIMKYNFDKPQRHKFPQVGCGSQRTPDVGGRYGF